MRKRLTNEEIDARLVGRNIKRLSSHDRYDMLMTFQCEIDSCQYIWKAQLGSVIGTGTGCAKCKGQLKFTNEIIDQRLEGRNIKRLDNYDSNKTPIRFLCLIDGCNHIWKTTTREVINRGSGCPKCAGALKLTNAIVDERLKGCNIKRLDDYAGDKIKIRFQCELVECQYIWKTRPAVIYSMGCGCPKCSGIARITNEIFDERIKDKPFTRISDCSTVNKTIALQCNKCSNVWSSTPNTIYKGAGCPNCSSGKNESRCFTILTENHIPFIHRQRLSHLNDEYPNMIVDFYLPEFNLIIEYNGNQHYFPVRFNSIPQEEAEKRFAKQQKRDHNLEEFCKEHNIRLIWIDGRTYTGNKLVEYMQQLVKEITHEQKK